MYVILKLRVQYHTWMKCELLHPDMGANYSMNDGKFIKYCKVTNILLLSTDLFHFLNIARRHSLVLKPFRNPHWYFENIFSKSCGIYLNMHFEIFFIYLEECWLLQFPLISFLPFLCRGNTCIFENFKKLQQFYGIAKAIAEKITKNSDVSLYNFSWDIGALWCLIYI